ncbi:sigma-70 family RNA polymerase sigma factor [Archangium violaceum]|uniref:RNA polymerase sigma factor n=1 Tax=Archangium violaceum TaxID=83451 RepID=UPI002B2E9B3D|nr:sigma-70 family RNA polymerase sigma factor [Archangium violaceum]
MQLDEREKLELEIQALCKRGDMAGAVERALEGYGQEIMRLMGSVLHDYERSRDAFSLFSENLLRGLSGFRWESSFRTWAYRLARNACYQVMHAPSGREQPVSMSALPDEALKPRSETRPWQRTSVKERFRALRESLDPQERMLLLLRVDQRLSWDDVARVMSEGEEALSDAALKRKAAALRQQFQRIKAHLRSLAEEEGLIASEDSSTHV